MPLTPAGALNGALIAAYVLAILIFFRLRPAIARVLIYVGLAIFVLSWAYYLLEGRPFSIGSL